MNLNEIMPTDMLVTDLQDDRELQEHHVVKCDCCNRIVDEDLSKLSEDSKIFCSNCEVRT